MCKNEFAITSLNQKDSPWNEKTLSGKKKSFGHSGQ